MITTILGILISFLLNILSHAGAYFVYLLVSPLGYMLALGGLGYGSYRIAVDIGKDIEESFPNGFLIARLGKIQAGIRRVWTNARISRIVDERVSSH